MFVQNETDLIAAARQGDGAAFADLIRPQYREAFRVGTGQSVATALAITRPGSMVGIVGVPHGVDASIADTIGLRGGVAPARAYTPELLDDVLEGRINPGRVFDFETDLDGVAEAYAAMNERRAIKSLIRIGTKGDALMTKWTSDQLDKVGKAEEVQVASVRRDGRLGKPVTVWVARRGDDLYLRSVRGRKGYWFRSTQERHEGRIRAGGVQQDVAFVDAGRDIDDEVDAAYQAKYRRYAGSILNSVLTPEARSTTIKLVPRSTGS